MRDAITIRELRTARGFSLRKTSLLVGISTSELSRVELGEHRLSGATRARFIDAFDLTADDIAQIAELTAFPDDEVRTRPVAVSR